jgi:hypothetical protein
VRRGGDPYDPYDFTRSVSESRPGDKHSPRPRAFLYEIDLNKLDGRAGPPWNRPSPATSPRSRKPDLP